MNSASPRYLALVSLTSILAVSIYCLGKPMSMPANTMVRMALINVFVEDQETGTPVQDLNYTDFQIFDNGSLVEPALFVSDTSRSITMWLLVSCPEQVQGQDGSGFLARNLSAIRQALANLDSTATVGVVHWCADGSTRIDVLPTQDHDAPLAALETILHLAPVEHSKSLSELAFQRVLDLLEKGQYANTEALPVIVDFFNGSLGLSRDDADLIAKKLLYRGMILYQVKNPRDDPREEDSPFQAISGKTGGRVYSVRDENSLQAMNSIMSALYSRYTLGLILRNIDSEWHEIQVRLTKPALDKHKSVRVDYSTGYLAAGSFGTVPPYSISSYRRATDSNLDSMLAPVFVSPTPSRDILFDFDGHGFIGSDELVEFSLRLGSDQLTWNKTSNDDRRSEIDIVVTSFSEEGKEIGHEVTQFEIVRHEALLGITGDEPFSTLKRVVLPRNASRIRVAVRDVATGKAGCQEFSLKEILSTPRSRMVIR